MNKIVKYTLIALLAMATASAGTSVSVGYQQKTIDFGKVTDTRGTATTGVDYVNGSFNAGVQVDTLVNGLDFVQLNEIKLKGGYTFVSSLADVTLGTQYSKKNTSLLNNDGRFRPFVAVGKGRIRVFGQYDLECELLNVEGTLVHGVNLNNWIVLMGTAFVGYTDANDVFPRSVKEIKYTNAYYGTGVDVILWDGLSVGCVVLRDNDAKKTSVGLRSSVTLKF